MSERQIKEYYERIEKLLNGANKETYGFAPQEIKNILRSYEELQNQNQELKKQLETINEQANYLRKSVERKEETIIDLQNERVPYTNEYIAKLENQQKEFIEYLENMLDDENDIFSVVRVKDVLSKYRKIIGVSDERKLIKNN